MRKLFLSVILCIAFCSQAYAADLSSMKWSQVCRGAMGDEWYGSAEALAVADIVVDVQKTNGGWMKNDELHRLTSAQLNDLKNKRYEHSCLDNSATTQEMRFLAKVWKKSNVEKYRTAFVRGLDMIFVAEKACGGWSQYWPLAGNGSYWDYITFNDDLMTNVMKLLRDIHSNKGDFAGIVDEATRRRCLASSEKGIDVILKCQVDDNGTKSAWCAQHDTVDFLPTEGRPHELPSISGSESANLLSFLMSLPDPSPELQEAITAGVLWLDSHKIEGKAVESYKNANGEDDRRIVDRPGSSIWGRFIQLGGESGKKVYEKFFNMLKNRGRKRTFNYQGHSYTYTEEEIARSSYREDKAYQPVFAIYNNDYPHLFYRFLYNYEDTDPVIDSKGAPVATSLMPANRSSYQYLGSWCQSVIEKEYPLWKQRIDDNNSSDEAIPHELSAATYSDSSDGGKKYNFEGGFYISNESGKTYATGKEGTVKFSAGVNYTIHIPEGVAVKKISFYGYDNYDTEAYISNVNGVAYSAGEYVFPAKVDGQMKYVRHTFDFVGSPAVGTLDFSLGVKQCCLIITLYCVEKGAGVTDITTDALPSNAAVKRIENGQIVIIRDGKTYNTAGQHLR